MRELTIGSFATGFFLAAGVLAAVVFFVGGFLAVVFFAADFFLAAGFLAAVVFWVALRFLVVFFDTV
jgi:hypothetical protein